MIWVILTSIAVCLLISYLSTSILYKIVFLALGGFIAITIGLNYINNLIQDSIKKSKELNSLNIKYRPNERGDNKSFKRKVIDNEDYIRLVESLKYSMKNKQLSRQQILDFKNKINSYLGSEKDCYTFKFDNDLHEIYCKIKNKSLTSRDYQELLHVLKSYNI